jgi:hypothetical protein
MIEGVIACFLHLPFITVANGFTTERQSFCTELHTLHSFILPAQCLNMLQQGTIKMNNKRNLVYGPWN